MLAWYDAIVATVTEITAGTDTARAGADRQAPPASAGTPSPLSVNGSRS